MKKHYLKFAGLLTCAMILYLGSCGDGRQSGQGDIDGKKLYTLYCALCHGDDGKREANGAFDITVSEMSLRERVALIRDGKNLMTPFVGILSNEEIDAVARYSMTLK